MQEFYNNMVLEFTKTFIRDNRWMLFLTGFQNTLIITVFAVLIGIAIGTVISVVHYLALSDKRKKSLGNTVLRIIDKIFTLYVSVMRGTPLAVQLTIMAFIIMAGYPNKIMVCTIAFGVNSGAYVSEVVRGGIQAVDVGQMEAGRSLGLSRLKTMWLIILPQAVKSILPALCNEGIAVLKETSIIGLIGVVDLTRASDLVRSRTFSPYFPLLSVALVYYLLVMLLSKGVSVMERRLASHDRH